MFTTHNLRGCVNQILEKVLDSETNLLLSMEHVLTIFVCLENRNIAS